MVIIICLFVFRNLTLSSICSEGLEKWIKSKKSESLFDEKCTDLQYLNDKVKEFLSMRCKLLLKRYPQIDKFRNENIENIVKKEKQILESYLM